jgi:hypothetical protein
MGGTQSIPKITAQDRAILEYAIAPFCCMLHLVDSPKSQNPARQTKAVSEEGRCCPLSPDGGDKKTVGSLFAPPFPQIQVVLDREYEVARQQLAAGHKDRAVVALRRRKYQEVLLAKTDGQLENLEQLVLVPAISLQIRLPPPGGTDLRSCRSRQSSSLSSRSPCYMASNRVTRFSRKSTRS